MVDGSGEPEEKRMSVKERISLFASQSVVEPAEGTEATADSVPKIKKVQRKQIAPKFVTPLVGVMVEPDSLVEMKGIIDGQPFFYSCYFIFKK